MRFHILNIDRKGRCLLNELNMVTSLVATVMWQSVAGSNIYQNPFVSLLSGLESDTEKVRRPLGGLHRHRCDLVIDIIIEIVN